MRTAPKRTRPQPMAPEVRGGPHRPEAPQRVSGAPDTPNAQAPSAPVTKPGVATQTGVIGRRMHNSLGHAAVSGVSRSFFFFVV